MARSNYNAQAAGTASPGTAEMVEAIDVLHDTRRRLDATYPLHLRHLAAQPAPVLFPTITRKAAHVEAS